MRIPTRSCSEVHALAGGAPSPEADASPRELARHVSGRCGWDSASVLGRAMSGLRWGWRAGSVGALRRHGGGSGARFAPSPE